ncbi:hypothetical protein [Kibdelosporangium aridum]|uniref:hypothetical protein n=1 Tax=Kibdelosporangium aridum TaxID=2030 RepID=UPI0035E5C0C6
MAAKLAMSGSAPVVVHGLSCQYVMRRITQMVHTNPNQTQVLCVHMGAGVSVTAIKAGGFRRSPSYGFGHGRSPSKVTVTRRRTAASERKLPAAIRACTQ